MCADKNIFESETLEKLNKQTSTMKSLTKYRISGRIVCKTSVHCPRVDSTAIARPVKQIDNEVN